MAQPARTPRAHARRMGVRPIQDIHARPPVTVPPLPKKKVVLVDGQSFNHPNTRRALNSGMINWGEFANILTKEVGEGELLGKIVMTTSTGHAPSHYVKALGVANIAVVPIDTAKHREADDEFIIWLINGIDPKEIGSLVLVTNDGSFADAVRGAKARGITIYWATANGFSRNGRQLVGFATQALINEDFISVDLRHDIANRIRQKRWEERILYNGAQIPETPSPQPSANSATPFKKIILSMELTVAVDRVAAILHSMGSLMGNVSRLDGITATITTVETK